MCFCKGKKVFLMGEGEDRPLKYGRESVCQHVFPQCEFLHLCPTSVSFDLFLL